MVGDAGSPPAPLLLHQLAQGQRRPPPQGLGGPYLRGRGGHRHPGSNVEKEGQQLRLLMREPAGGEDTRGQLIQGGRFITLNHHV